YGSNFCNQLEEALLPALAAEELQHKAEPDAKHAPAPGQPGPAQKPPGVVAYQGGGEEMASPAEADDSDEGYWDSPTPGPREDGSGGGVRKAGVPRDSDSGDALYDLYAEPDGSPAALPAAAEDTLPKDSKIPISIKHLANLPPSHPVVHQQPARSELPRTKIPVSKVLVRRVSSRGLAGTTLRAAACHDGAKKL
ncbi:hypothetical protein E2I00_017687, partial [Balaenoptera physalus]